MKNMLFTRLGKYMINLVNVREIYLGKEDEYTEVFYGGDIENTQIDPDELDKGALDKFESCILGIKDENVFFVKLGLYLVNLAYVLEIQFNDDVEIHYDTGDTTTIGKKDIESNALQKLNERLLA